MLAIKKKWETNLGSKCEGLEGESTLECEGLDIGDSGLIGDEDGLIGNGFCFGLGSEPSRMVLPKLSQMVRNDWVWLWVRTVANGYRQRFGFLSVTVWEVIGDGLGVIGDRLGFYWRQFGSEARQCGLSLTVSEVWFQKNKK